MNMNCIIFAATQLKGSEIQGKRVIEIGALNVNGSLRPIIEKYGPGEYIGVDISDGPGVDIKCDCLSLISRFGVDSFDLVVSTELLEHIRDWRRAIHNIKGICKPDGVVLITTRSFGFGYHGFPNDYWRYELKDMEGIFSDFKIEKLENDPQKGVMIKCVKPSGFVENDISTHSLYSIICGRRVLELTDNEKYRLRVKILSMRENLKYYLHLLVEKLMSSK